MIDSDVYLRHLQHLRQQKRSFLVALHGLLKEYGAKIEGSVGSWYDDTYGCEITIVIEDFDREEEL